MARIELSSHQGGLCYTLGGNTFIILSAGYLGSLLWGGIILVASARMKYDKEIVSILGAILLGVGVVYVRPIFSFGFPFCIVLGFALIMSGRHLSGGFNDTLAKIIGLTSCLYAAIDIISDGISRSIPCSDANALARLYLLPGWLWSFIWLVIAIVGTGFFLLVASAKDLDEAGKDQKFDL
jgi:peptidase M50B-like protein